MTRKKQQQRSEEPEDEEIPQRVTRQQVRQLAKGAEHSADRESSDAMASEQEAPQPEEDIEAKSTEMSPPPKRSHKKRVEAKSTEVSPAPKRSHKKRVLPPGALEKSATKPKHLQRLYTPGATSALALEDFPGPVELMQICVKPRKQSKGWEDLPELVLNIDPRATVMELQAEIHKQCPLLPPEAQQLYVQNASGHVAQLQAWGGGGEGEFMLLKDFGLTPVPLGHPPRTIWAELDADLLAHLTAGSAAEAPAAAAAAAPAPAPALRSRPLPGPRDDGSDWLTSPASSSRHRDDAPAQPAAPAAEASAGRRRTLDMAPVGQQPQAAVARASSAGPRVHQPLLQGSAPNHQAPTVNGERRRSKRWTAEETEALLAGIEAHGYSNWKSIQVLPIFHSDINRTTIDLKDKWRLLRNMVVNNTQPRAWPAGLDLDDTIARIWRIIHVNEAHLRHRVPNGIVEQD